MFLFGFYAYILGFLMKFNAAFFGLYSNVFLVLKKELGSKKALVLFRQIMEKGLKSAYDSMGFVRDSPVEFVRCTRERDFSVGLKVKYPVVSNDRIVYQFWTDPFPLLKNKVSARALCDTFMRFKVNYLLGSTWDYRLSKHFWNGDDCIEFEIFRT